MPIPVSGRENLQYCHYCRLVRWSG